MCSVCVFDLVGSSFRLLVMLSFVQCVLIRSMKYFFILMNRLLINLFIVMWRNTVLYFGAWRLVLVLSCLCECAWVFASSCWGIQISRVRVVIALCLQTVLEKYICYGIKYGIILRGKQTVKWTHRRIMNTITFKATILCCLIMP